ncbi:MAG: DNA repair protein RecN [Bacteroidia bacterium]|nr:DNA repair protein RecN [Bacteroidia bacterium]
MLLRLSIQNLALLRRADITWGAALNLITGETGAGKSLLIESLGALLGYKADFPPLSEKAIVEAEFAPIPPSAQALLEEKTESLLLRCEISPTGRKRLFLNDSPISASTIRELSYYLVEIHSQHDTQQLFHPPFQRELLDTYAELTEELHAYQHRYAHWKELTEKVTSLEKNQAEIENKLKWLEERVNELESARLSSEEYAQLERQIQALEHQAQIVQTLSYWYHQLGETPQAPTQVLREAGRALRKLPAPDIQSLVALLENAESLLQEATSQIEAILSSVSLEPNEIEKIRARFDTYNALLLKYRLPTVDTLIELLHRYKNEYQALLQERAETEPAKAELRNLTEELLERAYKLELARMAAAHTLADQVQLYLSELGLPHAHFHIAVERIQDPHSPLLWDGQPVSLTPYGFSSVTFLLRTHPQFPLAPLGQVASGGELSRIMLALKAALAEKVQLPTLVLDEIDTGLSGEGARKMGEFLVRLSQRFQIILITHLPAIAAQRGKHFFIWKEETSPHHWETLIRPLSEEERIREVARLLGGEAAGSASLAAAQELLTSAQGL